MDYGFIGTGPRRRHEIETPRESSPYTDSDGSVERDQRSRLIIIVIDRKKSIATARAIAADVSIKVREGQA